MADAELHLEAAAGRSGFGIEVADLTSIAEMQTGLDQPEVRLVLQWGWIAVYRGVEEIFIPQDFTGFLWALLDGNRRLRRLAAAEAVPYRRSRAGEEHAHVTELLILAVERDARQRQ